jgi:[acyl-carrier-protein] S-malonyltransferase
MKNAIIFPGQGAQKIGMGKELAKEYGSSREIFESVDESLGIKLSEIIWGDDLNALTLTENAQPALMASSMAIVAALEAEGLEIKCNFFAGHSLGEYTALCAAGAISLSDTARLLRTRGLAMQSCVSDSEGAMAAIIGLSAHKVQEILNNFSGKGVCAIANDNDPSQVVISGHCEIVEQVTQLLKKSGARRALQLKVSAPFHCEIMQPAAKIMEEALASISISTPKIPVVMNTRADAVSDPEQIRSFLVDQVVGMVRWRETINYMRLHGVSNFYELGVGKVLSGMVKRISNEVETINVSSPEDIKVLVGRVNNGISEK